MDRSFLLLGVLFAASVSACGTDDSTNNCQASDTPPAWTSSVVASTIVLNGLGGQTYTADATNTQNLTGRTDLFPAYRIARLSERSIRLFARPAANQEATLAQIDWTAPSASSTSDVSVYACPAGSAGFAGAGKCLAPDGTTSGDVAVARVVGQTSTAANGDVRIQATGSNVQVDLTLPALPADAATSCFAFPQIY